MQSSQIEGTHTELDELLAYEVTQDAYGKPADVRITQQYVVALQHGLDAIRAGGRNALTLDLIHAMHAILMRGEPDAHSHGRYRSLQAWIGAGGQRIEDARFVPTPPAQIDACMRELTHSMLQYQPREDEQTALSVIAQVAIAHAQFETIHPYRDGNGRVGRLLMPLILAAEHYPPLYPSGTLMRNRTGYYAALNRVQLRGDWSLWMDLACLAITESADDVLTTVDDLQHLACEWAEQTRGLRSHSVARRLPPLLLGYPVVSATQVADLLDVSYRSALSGIYELTEMGILAHRTERKWGRTYYANAVIDRLNQVPGEPHPAPGLR